MAGDLNSSSSIAERLLRMELRQPSKPEEVEAEAEAKAEQTEASATACDKIDGKHLGENAEEAAAADATDAAAAAADGGDEDAGEEEEKEEDEDDEDWAAEPEDLDELIQQVTSDNRRTRYFGIQNLRRRVSDSYEAPAYARLLTSPALAALVGCVDNDADPELQFEAAWALTNLLAGSGARPTDLVATSGLARPLVRLLRSAGTVRLREQACWALANVAGESPAWRDQLLAGGDLLAALLDLWDSDPNNGLLDASSLLLVNLLRDREPRIRFESVQQLLPPMVKLLRHPYEATVPHVVWALSYAVEDSEPRARLFLREPDALPRLLEFLDDAADAALLLPTLRLFCCLSACLDPLPVDFLAPGGVLDSAGRLLGHADAKVRRQALLFFGNVSAGPEAQLEAAARAGCLTGVGRILVESASAPTAELERREAFWIVPNFVLSRGHRFSKRIIDQCLDGFLETLSLQDTEISRCALLCLRHLLLAARYKKREDLDFEAIKRKIESNGALKKIELVQKMDDKELVKLSYQIIDQFFWGNEKKYLEEEQDCSKEASPTTAGSPADCEIGDDHHDNNGSEPERSPPRPDKEALSSLIGGLQARD